MGSSGKLEREDDRDVFGFEPVGDLGGLAAADDHRRGAELGGQVEGPVDLVAGFGLPPDGQLPVRASQQGLERGVEGRAYGLPLLIQMRSSCW